MLRNWWGGDVNVPCTCTHVRCYAIDGVGWGGVGMLTFLALAHMLDATQLMGWDGNVPCTCTHVGCYAIDGGGVGMLTFLAPAHMFDATPLMGWVGVGWGGDVNVPCTCAHVGCYAIDGVGWSRSLYLHTCWMLRNWWGGMGSGFETCHWEVIGKLVNNLTWLGAIWGLRMLCNVSWIYPPRARHHSSSFYFCRPNMVAVLTVHVRHVKNARGWPFVFKKMFFWSWVLLFCTTFG